MPADWTEEALFAALAPERRALFFQFLAERLPPHDFAEIEPILRSIVAWASAARSAAPLN